MVAQITSQFADDEHSVSIMADDFIAGGLKKDSYVRTNVLMTINPNRVMYKAGVISQARMKEIIDRIVQLFRTE